MFFKQQKGFSVKSHALVKTVVAIALLVSAGAGVYSYVSAHNVTNVKASSYDVNGYIAAHKITPAKTIQKDLHSFEMFHYSTKDKLPNGIVFHWTAAGTGSPDTAKNEAAYEINGHWTNAFVHTFIDHTQILNIHDTNYGAWGAGPYANKRFVHFELCTETTEANFAKSIVNAAYYAAYIAHQYGMAPTLGPDGTIWTHHQVSTILGGTTHVDPDEYLARWNYNTSKFLVLVKKYYNQLVAEKPYGSAITYKQYVNVAKSGYTLWSNLNWTKKAGNTSTYAGQLLYAKYAYGHSNGSRYLSLYNSDNKWLGYVNENAVTIADGAQGKYISYGKYVTLTNKGYSIWRDFDWKKSGKSSTTNLNQTYLAKGEYKHFNGSTYLSLYDGNGKWLGYINAKAATVASNDGGVGEKVTDYVTVKSSNYSIWGNFAWTKKRGTTASLQGKTLKATLKYHHYNGSTYYSLYDNQNKWVGYVNTDAMKAVKAQGSYVALGKYVTLTKIGYSIWRNFDWSSSKSTSTSLYDHTYLAKGEYHHFNGSTYLSLYDGNGTWIGYINAAAGVLASTPGGVNFNVNQTATVTSKNYPLWGNMTWSSKRGSTASYYGQSVYVKYKYYHVNGSTYYSLYKSNGGTWLGYVNAKAVSSTEISPVTPVSVPSNFYGLNVSALNATQKAYLKTLVSYAIPVARKYNLYPSVMVAQAVTETGWGSSTLFKNSNNSFGIKADASWIGDSYITSTPEVVNGKQEIVDAAFRKYSSLGESVEDYGAKVSTSSLYSALLRSNSATWTAAVKGLTAYATDPTYVTGMTTRINNYKFNLLDSVK